VLALSCRLSRSPSVPFAGTFCRFLYQSIFTRGEASNVDVNLIDAGPRRTREVRFTLSNPQNYLLLFISCDTHRVLIPITIRAAPGLLNRHIFSSNRHVSIRVSRLS
ncbi:hypothetical protein T265_13209, partial [Opisthorchis viverrini]